MTFVAGRANAGHYNSVVSQAHFPLNGNFEHASDDLTAVPPDHWAMTQGTWGAAGDAYFGTDTVYGRIVSLRQTAGDPNLRSSPWPVRRGMGHANVYLSVRQTGTQAAGRDLMLYFRFYSLADLSDSPTLYTFTIPNAYAAINTWATYIIDSNFFGALPVQANFCTLTFGKARSRARTAGTLATSSSPRGEQEALYVNKAYLASKVNISGTDSTGSPGAATINKPAGKSAIAAGASSVTITNSQVVAGATSSSLRTHETRRARS